MNVFMSLFWLMIGYILGKFVGYYAREEIKSELEQFKESKRLNRQITKKKKGKE